MVDATVAVVVAVVAVVVAVVAAGIVAVKLENIARAAGADRSPTVSLCAVRENGLQRQPARSFRVKWCHAVPCSALEP